MATRKPRTKKTAAAKPAAPAPEPKAVEVVTAPEGAETEPAAEPAPEAAKPKAAPKKKAAPEGRTIMVTHDHMGLIDNTPNARKIYKAGDVMVVQADRWPALKKLGYRRL